MNEAATFKPFFGTVYEVTCLMTSKRYIGSTKVSSAKRWQSHCSEARAGSKNPLYVAIRQFGESAFSLRDIATCKTREDLLITESAIIRQELTVVPFGLNVMPRHVAALCEFPSFVSDWDAAVQKLMVNFYYEDALKRISTIKTARDAREIARRALEGKERD